MHWGAEPMNPNRGQLSITCFGISQLLSVSTHTEPCVSSAVPTYISDFSREVADLRLLEARVSHRPESFDHFGPLPISAADHRTDDPPRSFHSAAELEQAIYRWLAHWNGSPAPFVWRASADVILDKVRRCKELTR